MAEGDGRDRPIEIDVDDETLALLAAPIVERPRMPKVQIHPNALPSMPFALAPTRRVANAIPYASESWDQRAPERSHDARRHGS